MGSPPYICQTNYDSINEAQTYATGKSLVSGIKHVSFLDGNSYG